MKLKKILLCVLCLVLLCSTLTGCSKKKKEAYSEYTVGILNAYYKGEAKGFEKYSGGTEENGKALHHECVQNLANAIKTHYSLDNAEITDSNNEFFEVANLIYSRSKYTVSEAYKKNGNYYVDVTVSPVDVLVQSNDDIIALIEKYNKDITDGVYNDTKKEDYETQFALDLVQILKAHTDTAAYEDDVTIKVQITENDDVYYIESSELEKVDAVILAQ